MGCVVLCGEERDLRGVSCCRKTRGAELAERKEPFRAKDTAAQGEVVELCAAGPFSKGLWVHHGTPNYGPCAVVRSINPSAFLFSSSSSGTSSSLSWLPTSPRTSPLPASSPGRSWWVSWLTPWPASTTEHPPWDGGVPAPPPALLSPRRCSLGIDHQIKSFSSTTSAVSLCLCRAGRRPGEVVLSEQ